MEENGKIAFLGALIIKNNFLKYTAYIQKTHSRAYLYWKSFMPPTRKCSTLHLEIMTEPIESAQLKNI